MPISFRVASVHHESSFTNGRATTERNSIGRATRRAIVSGYIRPSRLGTSSPKTMLRKVMVITTIAVAAISATRSRMLKVCCSQRPNGAEKAASPTMPLRTLIEVMPICTTDSHLVGLSCSAIAWMAPESPDSTITCRRALRLAVSAISDMANSEFRKIRKSRRATSMPCGSERGRRREGSVAESTMASSALPGMIYLVGDIQGCAGALERLLADDRLLAVARPPLRARRPGQPRPRLARHAAPAARPRRSGDLRPRQPRLAPARRRRGRAASATAATRSTTSSTRPIARPGSTGCAIVGWRSSSTAG